MGKFLTCKPFNKKAAQYTLKRAWGLEEGVQIVEVGANLYQFKFRTEFDMERILRGGPWSFDNQALMLRRWQKGMTVENVKFDAVSLWVQIWGAPFDMFSPKVAEEIGSRLGTVEAVEKRPNKEAQNLFMRVRVALPISKAIQRGGFVAGSDVERCWVNFKYERLPIFCNYCGFLGHDLKHCARHYAASKQEGEVRCQYGDWLRATGLRSRSPPKRELTRFGSSDPEGGVESGGEGKADGQQVAADIPAKANPSTLVTHAKCISVNGGADPDFMELNESNAEMGGTVIENLEVIEGESNVREVNILGGVNAIHYGDSIGCTKLDVAKTK